MTASQTPHQARKGIVDNPSDHWRDMAGFNGDLDGRDHPALRRVLADAMPETFRWLFRQGVRFYGPMPEPPHSKPRMHNVLPNSRAFITHLAKAARRNGATIQCGVRASALVVEKDRVAAINCETANGARRVRARGGIVLATGDFTSDPELKAQFMGAQEAKIDGVNVTATGDGQKLALPLGARIINGYLALGPELRFVPPQRRNILLRLPPWPMLANLMAWSLDHMPSALLRPFVMSFVTTALAPSPDLFAEGAILFNRRGERFADELDEPAYALPDQPGKVGYILLDKRLAKLFSGWAKLGASRIIVLPTGYACALNEPPRSAVGKAVHAITLMIAWQLMHELEGIVAPVNVHIVPTLCPLAVSPFDFSRSMVLIERAEYSSRKWIDDGGLSRSARPQELAPHRH